MSWYYPESVSFVIVAPLRSGDCGEGRFALGIVWEGRFALGIVGKAASLWGLWGRPLRSGDCGEGRFVLGNTP